jgi:hypothetical protein
LKIHILLRFCSNEIWVVGLTNVLCIPKFSNGIVVVLGLGELHPHAQPKSTYGVIVFLGLDELDPLKQPKFLDHVTFIILGLGEPDPPTKPKVVLPLERVCAFIATTSY